MSWETRVQDAIVLMSPSKVPLPAYWMPPDEVSFQRHVAVHDIPNRAGSYVQDMGAGSRRYPITLVFEGEQSDLLAKAAEDLLFAEQGAWTVIHPTDLFLKLNLVSCSRTVDPVNSGGLVTLKTEWVEVGLEITGLGGLAASVAAIARACLAVAAPVADAVKTAVNITQRGLLGKYVAGNMKKFAAFVGGWTLTGDAGTMAANVRHEAQHVDAENSGTFTALLLRTCVEAQKTGAETPAVFAARRVETSCAAVCAVMEEQIKTYSNLGGNFAIKMVNDAAGNEIFLAANLIAFAETVTENPIRNRDECVTLISMLDGVYERIIRTAALYEQKAMPLELSKQYAAFLNSMGEIEKLRSLVIRYLLNELYDLKAIRRITLEKPATLAHIACRYMGADAATIDEKMNELIESNNIAGTDILLLPAGKEIAIYG